MNSSGSNKKLLYFSVLVLLVLGSGLVYFGQGTFFGQNSNGNNSTTQTPSPTKVSPSAVKVSPTPAANTTPTTFEGEIVCLPHKGSGPTTLECAYGLKDSQGAHYALIGLDQQNLIEGKINVGDKVRIKGNFSLPKADEKYNIYGQISINQIEIHQ